MKRLLLHRESSAMLCPVSVSTAQRHRFIYISRQGCTTETKHRNNGEWMHPCPLMPVLWFIRSVLYVLSLYFWAAVCVCAAWLHVATVSKSLSVKSMWEVYICTGALGNIRRVERRNKIEWAAPDSGVLWIAPTIIWFIQAHTLKAVQNSPEEQSRTCIIYTRADPNTLCFSLPSALLPQPFSSSSSFNFLPTSLCHYIPFPAPWVSKTTQASMGAALHNR